MRLLQKLIVTLKKENLTIAVAESCSAGYLSYLLTKIPGSSKVLKGSIVVYSLESKHTFFHIPYSLLYKTQGVSNEIVKILAQKVHKIFKADIGVSIVGFAGPGAQRGKQPGTIFIAVAGKTGVVSKKIVLKGSRDHIRKEASLLAIQLLYKKLHSQYA